MSLLYCSLNGERQFNLSPLDRGLSYGDGVFTTAKVVAGQVLFLNEHIKRLHQSCSVIGLTAPPNDLYQQLVDIALSFEQAVMKVVITSGVGGRGYARPEHCSLNILITVHEYPSHYDQLAEQGVNLGIAESKLGINPVLAGLKHLNRLEQVLIKQELESRKEQELIVLNYLDQVIEVSAGNLFCYHAKEKKWYTPCLDKSGVDGIIRQHILITNAESQVIEMTLDNLEDYKAMFICNSVMGIIPVSHFCGRTLDVLPVLHMKATLNL